MVRLEQENTDRAFGPAGADLQNSHASHVAKFPSLDERALAPLGEPSGVIGPIKPSAVQFPNVKARRSAERYDARFQLHGKDAVAEHQLDVGREWYLAKGRIHYVPGTDWGSEAVKLQPAVAGIGGSLVDRLTATIGPSLQTFFAASPAQGQQNINPASAAQIKDLSLRKFNPVAFIWRLASLYLGAAHLEINDRQAVIAYNAGPEVRWMTDTGVYQGALAGLESTENIVGVKQQTYFARNLAAYARVLGIAATARPGWADSRRLPRVALDWPALPNAQLWVFGNQVNIPWGGSLSSEEVLDAAVDWCQLHGHLATLRECITTIAAMWYTPSGGAPVMDSRSITVPLPAPKMSAGAITVFVASYDSVPEEGMLEQLRDVRAIFDTGVVTTLMLQLGYRAVGASMGAHQIKLDHDLGLGKLHRFDYRSWQPRKQADGAGAFVAGALKHYGVDVAPGRILGAIGLDLALPSLMDWMTGCLISAQWEEALLFTKAIPSTAGIAGLLKPMRLDTLLDPQYWYPFRTIGGGSDAVRLYNGLQAHAHGVELGLKLTHRIEGTQHNVDVRLEQNYAGRFADWQTLDISRHPLARGDVYVKVRNVQAGLRAYAGDAQADQRVWVVSKDEHVDDIATKLGFDAPAAGGPDMLHAFGMGPPNGGASRSRRADETSSESGGEDRPRRRGSRGSRGRRGSTAGRPAAARAERSQSPQARPESPAPEVLEMPAGQEPPEAADLQKVEAVSKGQPRHLGNRLRRVCRNPPPKDSTAWKIVEKYTQLLAAGDGGTPDIDSRRKLMQGELLSLMEDEDPTAILLKMAPASRGPFCALVGRHAANEAIAVAPGSRKPRVMAAKAHWHNLDVAMRVNNTLTDAEWQAKLEVDDDTWAMIRAVLDPAQLATLGSNHARAVQGVAEAILEAQAAGTLPADMADLAAVRRVAQVAHMEQERAHDEYLQAASEGLKALWEAGELDSASVHGAMDMWPDWMPPEHQISHAGHFYTEAPEPSPEVDSYVPQAAEVASAARDAGTATHLAADTEVGIQLAEPPDTDWAAEVEGECSRQVSGGPSGPAGLPTQQSPSATPQPESATFMGAPIAPQSVGALPASTLPPTSPQGRRE
uniref:Capsid protein n=1 Tax=Elkhorn sea moss toti-like virus TaxID=2933131 RepID=A0A9C7GWI3_9VIRU|nr:putative capsid protein [Elkhorn sea moss toti-like virus]CAI5383873.1 putative capsid protein [Elkhorn sea moss toti-like virus]